MKGSNPAKEALPERPAELSGTTFFSRLLFLKRNLPCEMDVQIAKREDFGEQFPGFLPFNQET
jgi:hypothetical protein